jgi:hypothetical protein
VATDADWPLQLLGDVAKSLELGACVILKVDTLQQLLLLSIKGASSLLISPPKKHPSTTWTLLSSHPRTNQDGETHWNTVTLCVVYHLLPPPGASRAHGALWLQCQSTGER